MKLISYSARHLDEILAEGFNRGAPSSTFGMDAYKSELEKASYSYTVVCGDDIVMCCGLLPMWDGVADTWMLGSVKLHKHRSDFIRHAKGAMLSVFKDLGMRRVQGAVSVNWEEAARFAHYMGFEEEGVMRKYGPDGSDYIRVAWVR